MISTLENLTPAAPLASASPSRSVGGKKTAHPKEIRETVQVLFFAGIPPHAITAKTGVPKHTVQKWATRGGWVAARDALAQHIDGAVASTIAEKLSQRSEQLQDALSGELVEQTQVLREHPPRSVGDLIKGRSATVKTIVDSSDKLFGWNQSSGPGCLVQIGLVNELMPQERLAKSATEPAVNV
jgi:hypothetical protein